MTDYTDDDVRTLAGMLRGYHEDGFDMFVHDARRLLESGRVTLTDPRPPEHEPGTLARVLPTVGDDYETAHRNDLDTWVVLYRDGSIVMMTDHEVDDVRPVAVVDADDVEVITYEISPKIKWATGVAQPRTHRADGEGDER